MLSSIPLSSQPDEVLTVLAGSVIVASTTERWTTSLLADHGTEDGANVADPNNPIALARDGSRMERSKPFGLGSDFYLLMAIAGEFDWLIIDHNTGDHGEVTWTVDVDDDAGFATPTQIYQGVHTTSRRISTRLNDRWSGTGWLRVRSVTTSGLWEPRVGEVVLGRERQLDSDPDHPYQRFSRTRVQATEQVTLAGGRYVYATAPDQVVETISGLFSASEYAWVFDRLRLETEAYRHSFWACPTPNSDPRMFEMSAQPREVNAPFVVGGQGRRVNHTWVEVGPYVSAEPTEV